MAFVDTEPSALEEREESTWFAPGWSTARGGLRTIFWAWLAGALLIGVQLLSLLGTQGVARLGGDALYVPTGNHYASDYYAAGAGLYAAIGLLVVSAVTALSAARLVSSPRPARGGKAATGLGVGLSIAFLASLALSIAAFPGARTLAESRQLTLPGVAAAVLGADLAWALGAVLLLAALDRMASVLGTSRRRVLISLAMVAVLARAAVAVAVFTGAYAAPPALLPSLTLASLLVALPVVGGMARTLAVMPELRRESYAPYAHRNVESVPPRAWLHAAGGLEIFGHAVRAKLVLLTLGAGFSLAALAPSLAGMGPLLAFALPLMGCAIAAAMVFGVDRYLDVPLGSATRWLARAALLLIGLGALAEGAVAMYRADRFVAAAPATAPIASLQDLALLLPALGLVVLLFSFAATVRELGAPTVARRLNGTAALFTFLVMAAFGLRLGARAAGWSETAPASLVTAFAAVAFGAIALGRLLGATEVTRARLEDVADEARFTVF